MPRSKSLISGLAIAVACFLLSPVAMAARQGSSVPLGQLCDRACLYGFLDQYLAALNKKDPSGLPLSPHALFSENNVKLMFGDGLWNTIDKVNDYALRFADPDSGTVGYFGEVTEHGVASPFTMWMKVRDGKITVVETQVRRAADEALASFLPPGKLEEKPVLNEMMAKKDQLPRAKLISIADGYFDTLQLNDGTLYTKFADDCDRVENGIKTTHNDTLKAIPIARLGCAEQFRMGNFRYDDRLRARRYPLVDIERGLVLATGFIDHSGRIVDYKLADGTPATSPIQRPHSFYLMELFKINARGEIQQIESVFMTVPYHMPYPW